MKSIVLVSLLASAINLFSPDGRTVVSIETGNEISYSVSSDGTLLLDKASASLTLGNGQVLGSGKPSRVSGRKVSTTVQSPVYRKAEIAEEFNEKTLHFRGGDVVFRAYDNGVAYRFVVRQGKPFTVTGEKAAFRFAEDFKSYVPYCNNNEKTYEGQFFNSFERTYAVAPLSQWEKGRLAFLPMMVATEDGHRICITDADQLDYPGMFLSNEDGDATLESVFAAYPKKWHEGGHHKLQRIVEEREDYIASFNTKDAVNLPWRAMAITANDVDMADNDLVYLLSTPADDRDWSWVRPGKVAWDWWNDWNIRNVPFEAGVNNETYKYYIDFASANGIEYVILDEGWAVSDKVDLFDIAPEIDLEMLCSYAQQKGVGLILWAGYNAFAKDVERVCKHYSEMGVKGFKVDFMDSDNQQTISFLTGAAKIAAEYHMMLDYHGICKPAGLTRTYPNVINYEGIFGLEQLKWSKPEVNMVEYDVTAPYIRFLAGPADYTQGAMRNATRKSYYPCNSEPMSQGTRCHQLALYVIYSSPLNMLCDSPSNYLENMDCTKFIAQIPTVWDETVAIDGKIGEYIVMARRSGDTWYIGGTTNWDARDITLDLGKLGLAGRNAEIFTDGANAHRNATDHTTAEIILDNSMQIHLAPGGGFAIKVSTK